MIQIGATSFEEPARNKRIPSLARKIVILEKKRNLNASRKSVEFRRGIRQTVKRNPPSFSGRRKRERANIPFYAELLPGFVST